MGLWQKLFGWLNPSAPTAAHAERTTDPHTAHSGNAPLEPGFAVGAALVLAGIVLVNGAQWLRQLGRRV